MVMIYAFAALCLFGGALAQSPSTGPCPKVEAVRDLEVSRILGRWYEAERYFSALEIGTKCNKVDLSRGENNTISVVATLFSSLTGSPTSINAAARIPNPAEAGKLKVKHSLLPLNHDFDVSILGTDYDSYAVAYSCVNVGRNSVKFAWIMTRDQHPANSAIAEAYEVVAKNNLSTSSFSETERRGC